MENLARKSGMRGMEREEAPKAKPGDNYGNIGMHVKQGMDGDSHLNMSSLVDHLEQQKTGPHDDRAGAFAKPNADKLELGGSRDSAKDAKGSENG
jgi:hypothetical protein